MVERRLCQLGKQRTPDKCDRANHSCSVQQDVMIMQLAEFLLIFAMTFINRIMDRKILTLRKKENIVGRFEV